jgi:hypothetical protein
VQEHQVRLCRQTQSAIIRRGLLLCYFLEWKIRLDIIVASLIFGPNRNKLGTWIMRDCGLICLRCLGRTEHLRELTHKHGSEAPPFPECPQGASIESESTREREYESRVLLGASRHWLHAGKKYNILLWRLVDAGWRASEIFLVGTHFQSSTDYESRAEGFCFQTNMQGCG